MALAARTAMVHRRILRQRVTPQHPHDRQAGGRAARA